VVGVVHGRRRPGADCARIAASSAGRSSIGKTVAATTRRQSRRRSLERVEQRVEIGARRHLHEEQPVRRHVVEPDRRIETEDREAVRAEAVVLLAAGIQPSEKGADAVEAWKRREAARAEAIGNDDGAVGTDQRLAGKRIARVERIVAEDGRGAALATRRQSGRGPERGARMQPAAGRAERAGGDQRHRGAAAGGRTGTMRRRPNVVGQDQRVDLGAEHARAATRDGDGLQIAAGTVAAADRHVELAQRAVAPESGPRLGVGDGAGVEGDGRIVVELDGERRGVGSRGESQQHEQVAVRDSLAPSRAQDVDQLGARMAPQAIDGGTAKGVRDRHVRVVARARERPAHAAELADRVRGVAGVARRARGGEPQIRRVGACAEGVDAAGDPVEPGLVGTGLCGGHEAGGQHQHEAEAPGCAHDRRPITAARRLSRRARSSLRAAGAAVL
jgi:hypothetical protein